MKNEFIPYEEALALKELGFNEDCITHWYEGEFEGVLDVMSYPNRNSELSQEIGELISAPLYQQAFRFFKEKCGLDGETTRYNLSHSESKILKIDRLKAKHIYLIVIDGVAIDFENVELKDITYYFSKEEAELACLKKLIEIVKNKENENNNQ